jgi:hypothetical protein
MIFLRACYYLIVIAAAAAGLMNTLQIRAVRNNIDWHHDRLRVLEKARDFVRDRIMREGDDHQIGECEQATRDLVAKGQEPQLNGQRKIEVGNLYPFFFRIEYWLFGGDDDGTVYFETIFLTAPISKRDVEERIRDVLPNGYAKREVLLLRPDLVRVNMLPPKEAAAKTEKVD